MALVILFVRATTAFAALAIAALPFFTAATVFPPARDSRAATEADCRRDPGTLQESSSVQSNVVLGSGPFGHVWPSARWAITYAAASRATDPGLQVTGTENGGLFR